MSRNDVAAQVRDICWRVTDPIAGIVADTAS